MNKVNGITMQWWIQDLPNGGVKPLILGQKLKIFAENCMKMKEIGSRWGRGSFAFQVRFTCGMGSVMYDMDTFAMTVS